MTQLPLAAINAMPLEAPPYKSPEHVRLPAVDFSPRSAPGAYPTLGIPQLLKYNGRNIQGMSRVALNPLTLICQVRQSCVWPITFIYQSLLGSLFMKRAFPTDTQQPWY